MIVLKIIINISILIFLIKTISLLWSFIAYKICYKKHYKVKSSGLLNDNEYKGKILFLVLLDHTVDRAKEICEMYTDILQGYRNAHVVFVTNEQEEIEIKMKHNDEITTRQEISKYIDDANKKLDRRDAIKLIHYPYDNDNKSQMIDFATKEFMTSYETIDKMQSYVGIFEGDSIVEQAFLTRLDKTITKYNYPKLIETIKVKTFMINRINKLKKSMEYLYNANETSNNIVKNIFDIQIRKLLFLNKLLPYSIKLNGTLIRLDLFYEEEMLGTSVEGNTIAMNYYLKNVTKEIMYTEVDEYVTYKTLSMNKELEDEFVSYHNMKRQANRIKSYRLVSKLKYILLNIHNNALMVYNGVSPYVIFFILVFLLFMKSISMKLLISFIASMYLYAFVMLIGYRIKSKPYDSHVHGFKKFILRVLSFIFYPIFLVYRCNGLYDYIRTRSLVNRSTLSHVKGIR